jgi:hypothetical protein
VADAGRAAANRAVAARRPGRWHNWWVFMGSWLL